MPVIVVGLNHRSAPLDLLERMTVATERLPKALRDLVGREHLTEAVVLSTCNRTEIYVQAERFHPALAEVRAFLTELADIGPDAFSDQLYTFHDAAAVAQLFAVAGGLDSAVLGESEIIGQVRRAWDVAVAEGACGPALNMVFRHAVVAGKRVRTETGIARRPRSMSSAAVGLAARHLGGLAGKRALVVGVGQMGEGLALGLARAGCVEVLVANRTRQRAEDLADRMGGRAVAFAGLAGAVAEVDVVLTSVGSSLVVLDHAELESVMATRADRPLLVLDVAVPRDVDPGAGALPGVTLLDMDDLRAHAEESPADRRHELSRARDLIDDEVARYREAFTARLAAPMVTALRARLEAVRVAEVNRLGRQLGPAERARLEDASRALAAKILHEPTVRLKEAAGTIRGERLAEALSELFGL